MYIVLNLKIKQCDNNIMIVAVLLAIFVFYFDSLNAWALTHHGPVMQYGCSSILCKNPIFFTMKEFPQI